MSRTLPLPAEKSPDKENVASRACLYGGSLQAFIAHRRREGAKTRTTNHALQVVRHILNLAAGEWLDEHDEFVFACKGGRVQTLYSSA